jgi:4-hydroxy-2-oxoheptanedioate aldolase
VDTTAQALTAVKTMRYPPMRGAARREPVGIRGFSTAAASYAWGVSPAEYERRADVWPLNPEGDLLAVIMIESVEGLEHLDQIARVPGVGALFLGAGSDLSRSMGVPANSPEVEAAFQRVLKACKTHTVACGITASSTGDIVRRVKEGWSIIRSTVPAITPARTQLGDR